MKVPVRELDREQRAAAEQLAQALADLVWLIDGFPGDLREEVAPAKEALMAWKVASR